MNPLPVRAEKIEPPYLRPDTLSRKRLNGWLDRAAKGRLALVIADAGFGKTTLLGDWSNLSRRHVAWYRLEHDDRDWLTLVRHLVGGGRKLDAEFAPETYRMLCSLGPGGPTRDEIIESLARESAAFGAANSPGFSLILDDYHAIEGSNETDPVIAGLLKATGDGFSMILSARKAPELPPLGGDRLRGHRLEGDELRFTVPETEALFRDAYAIPLEHDVTVELVARTEGWAALLSLVRTRLEEQPNPDPRALVAQLSATQGDLYDFLAGEVLVDLPAHLSDFLMRVSLLSEVSPRTVELTGLVDAACAETSIKEAERLGFLVESERHSSHRFHPLVREFLSAQLEASLGREELRRQHLSIAIALEQSDWREAALHYRAAGRADDAARVIDEAIPAIIGSGLFDAVVPLLDGTAGCAQRTGALILRSRVEYVRGNLERALALAAAATEDATGPLAGSALLNHAALEAVAGYPDRSIERTVTALEGRLADPERKIAEASFLIRGAQTDGDLEAVADALRQLANEQEFADLKRYAAISHLNLALVLNWLGNPNAALKSAVWAETVLAETPESIERVSATAARALALMQLRKQKEADLVMGVAQTTAAPLGRMEADLEIAHLQGLYGSLERAQEALDRVDVHALPAAYRGFRDLLLAMVEFRRGDTIAARETALAAERAGLRDVAGRFRTNLLLARTSHLLGAELAAQATDDLVSLATSQRSRACGAMASILRATSRPGVLGPEICSVAEDCRHVLSVLAEEVSGRLQDLSPQAMEIVTDEAEARPERWRSALRLVVCETGPARLPAARLLARIGSDEDGALLRSLAKGSKAMRDVAALATRRLAPKARLRDLGVFGVELGNGRTERISRRKAMALLCFLTSRPRQAATKDEALDALWPEFTPDMALNSLHQAIYYVRRVFDPEFREGVSAGYLTFDGEILSLDPKLVQSDSGQCWELLRSTSPRDISATEHVLGLYRGRFAIDFTYEDWSIDYRDTLHAAVLSRVEAAITNCHAAGEPDRAIGLATTILSVDPSADSIELALLRAYKAAGRHAAAGEQYSHYAASIREGLGVEPVSYDSI